MPDEPLRTTTFTLTRADALAYEQAAGRLTPLGTLALLCWLGLWGAAALLLPDDWAGPRLGWAFSVLVSVGMPREVAFGDIRRSVLTRTHLFLDADDGVIMLPRRAFKEEGAIEDLSRRIDAAPHPAVAAPEAPTTPPA